MTGVSLEGRAVLVVGASAGIGRAFAEAAVRSGADVVLSARREAKLADAIAAAGGGHAVVGDACEAGDCGRVVAEAVEFVGPLELLVYAAGWAPLRALADTTPEEWGRALATNVVGANQMIRAAVPQLAPAAVVAALSSEAATMPRYGLGAYGASKAALEASVRGWRNEHPEVRFCNVVVGQTFPTEFGDGFEAEALAAAFEHWGRNGLLQSEFMTPEGVATVLVSTFAAALAHPDVGTHDLVLRSPSAAVGPAPATVTAPATTEAIAGTDRTQLPSESPPGTRPPWA
jgi:NAD(P)-dependent dehydrogenase (short-subunit alcohol dehydrogenase family)